MTRVCIEDGSRFKGKSAVEIGLGMDGSIGKPRLTMNGSNGLVEEGANANALRSMG